PLPMPPRRPPLETFDFPGCTSLTSVTIPASVETIESYAFRGCTSLTSVTIPASVTIIKEHAFSGCTNLQTVSFGAGSQLATIGNCAFQESGLTEIVIPDTVTSLGGIAFSDCTSLKTVTIGSGITTIQGYTFNGCTNLTTIKIPDSVTTIGERAFKGCTSLTSITIPDSVTSIAYGAFSGCTSLTSITIPDSVTSIGNYAFSGCTGLTEVTIMACGTTYDDTSFDNTDVINQTAHTWGEGHVTAATETTDEKILYTCTVCGTEKTETIHSWGETTYDWDEENKTCTATRKCTICEDVTETAQTATVTETVSLEPTCTDMGQTTYTAVFAEDWATNPTSLVLTNIPATGHTYDMNTFSWNWSEDYSSATISFSCINCGDVHTENATVTSEVTTAATETEAGVTVYTAVAKFNDRVYANVQAVTDISATGHSYGAPVFTWAEDGKSAVASFTCETCGDVQSVIAAVTSEVKTAATATEAGVTLYTAAVTFDGVEYTDTKELTDIPATGEATEPPAETATPSASPTATAAASPAGAAPSTGDEASPLLWAILAAVCAAGLGAALALARKERTAR
ncbi:MAG: leucine-rich repeat domain-containing protein, partial [Oscillospiraceae bacterium]|nr:leucine-rich repeat domain-containing protein [Oscillospiraceae bacterium]